MTRCERLRGLGVLLQTEPNIDPNIVRPGWTPLLIIVLLLLVLVFLFFSMQKQMRKIRTPDDIAPGRGGGSSRPRTGPAARPHARRPIRVPVIPSTHPETRPEPPRDALTDRNLLADATSPYLLQHADNPVHWRPWSDEAFAEAEQRGVPVFLSVGYAACHWCHVMAHESFEDAETADVINAGFVAVKVDREERPDVDAVYMTATQALTGQGGWPMSVFLTPDRRPFYAGTYFPPTPRHGLPSFREVLNAVSIAWRERRSEVLDERKRHPDRARRSPARPSGVRAHRRRLPRGASPSLRVDFDAAHGGFGGAPKFPPSMVLEALLRYGDEDGDHSAPRMAAQTLEAMARGGIYDQLAGGFARYSVDSRWVVPHFEKMLYDNALLLGVYVHWWRLTGHRAGRAGREETVEWLLTEMRSADGGFTASLDADSLDADGHLTRGRLLRLVPGPVDRGAGPRRRAVGGRGLLGDVGGDLRARPLHPPAPHRRRSRAVGPGSLELADGA